MPSAFQVKTRAEYFDDAVNDIRNTMPQARVLTPGDDLYDAAAADSESLQKMAGHLDDSKKESFDHTASLASLVKRNYHKIGGANPATPARLSVIITGTAGSTWATTHILSATQSGIRYAPLAGGVMPAAETTTITVEALTGGDETALPSGTQLVWESPPAGLSALATSTGNPSGGANAEDVEDYRARVFDFYRNPVAGGTLHDFEQWALRADGVGYATAIRYRRAVGTVDVAVLDPEMDDVSDTVLGYAQDEIDAETPALPRTVYAVKPVRTEVHVTRSLVMAPGYGFSSFSPRTTLSGSTASALVVSDTTGIAVGDWAALKVFVNGRARFCARPVYALEVGATNRVLVDPPFPGDPIPSDAGVWPSLRPGCPVYDVIALSIQDYVRSLRGGETFYNGKCNDACTQSPEVMNAVATLPAADVAAVVTAATFQWLVLGELILVSA
jgi:uncharacterized phage protein gp47/JayE